jgi:hypothetical protein
MVIRAPAVQVVGGQREREVLDRMPVYGEPGIGKTALFESVRNATPSKVALGLIAGRTAAESVPTQPSLTSSERSPKD